jgi:hypothetical protein
MWTGKRRYRQLHIYTSSNTVMAHKVHKKNHIKNEITFERWKQIQGIRLQNKVHSAANDMQVVQGSRHITRAK